jgi:hypothetical protein
VTFLRKFSLNCGYAAIIFVCLLEFLTSIAPAQVPKRIAGPTPALQFEAASIKPSTSDSRSMTMTMRPGGRFTASKVSAKMLIKVAYGLFLPWPGGPGPVTQNMGMGVPSSFVVPDSQVDGGEKWADSDKFDIEAKAEVPVRNEVILMMLRSMLEDRFKLKTHGEQREMQAYLLVIASNGVKMERVIDYFYL